MHNFILVDPKQPFKIISPSNSRSITIYKETLQGLFVVNYKLNNNYNVTHFYISDLTGP